MRRLLLLCFIVLVGCVNDRSVGAESEDAETSAADATGDDAVPHDATVEATDAAARDAAGDLPPDAAPAPLDAGIILGPDAAPLDVDLGNITGPDAAPPDHLSHLFGVAHFADVAAAEGHGGIVVEVEGRPFGAVTDGEGRYALDVPPGQYTLHFQAEGYADVRLEIVAAPGPSDVPGVVLVPEPGRIEGTVVAPPGVDAPALLAGARVHLALNAVFDQELAVQALDPDEGRFSFEIAEHLVYFLYAEAGPYVSDVVSVEGLLGRVVDVGELVLRLVEPPPAPTGVQGVARREGADDHAGIVVQTVGAPFATVTDAGGRYLLEVPPGFFDLRFSAEGYASQVYGGVDVAPGAVVQLDDVLLLAQPGAITGTVELSGNDGPLDPGLATVTLAARAAPAELLQRVSPGADGRFRLEPLTPGEYIVTAGADGFVPQRVAAAVGPGETVALDPMILERVAVP